MWKNFGDVGKLVRHFLSSPRRQMRRAGLPGVGIRLEAKAFLGAVKRLSTILRSKLQLASSVVRSDEEILQLISTPPTAAIQKSEVDFERADCAEQLGDGWYPRDQANGKSFRWMSRSASVFLRAPAETAELSVRGYASHSPGSDGLSLTLAVNCRGQRKSFQLREGLFEERWRVTGLLPYTPVPIQLAVSHAFTTPMDSRVLGMIVHRIALSDGTVSDGGPPAELHPPVSVGNRLAPSKLGIPGQRRILMVCPYVPCLGMHGGGNMMFHLIRALSKRHRLTVLTFYERDEERERIAQLAPFCEQVEGIFRGQSFEHSDVLGLKPPEIVNEFYHQRMWNLVRKYLRTQKFDLIQCEYLQTAHFANVDRNIPAVLTMHELLSLCYADRYLSLIHIPSPRDLSTSRMPSSA